MSERLLNRNKTKIGNYGYNATPAPTTYDDEMYSATTISFLEETDSRSPTIVDSDERFRAKHINTSFPLIVVTDSGVNDGTYTITGVSRSEILVSESLTSEPSPGTVVLSRRIYKPNITTGCPLCGSQNSKE
jgi:hypothetical protein